MLDQIYLKLDEIQTGITTFIQKLVLANAGHVTRPYSQFHIY